MQTRSLRRPVLWLVGGICLATVGYAGAHTLGSRPPTGRYEAESRWGDDGSGGVHRVQVDVTRRGRGTYVEYGIHMDPPGQTAGCSAEAERTRDGRLEFSCNDGWNDVRGSFHASGDTAVLRIDDVAPGGGGLGAFYGEHSLGKVGATPAAARR